MIEIRAFDGRSDELANFMRPIWKKTYTEKMAIPVWTSEFLDWALDWESRDHLITAWDDQKLVGCLLATVYDMQYLGQKVKGTHGSFLTVDPEYRRQGIAGLMADGMRKANERHQVAFELGYLYTGHGLSMGPKFWTIRTTANLISRAGYWTRVLDHKTVADWDYNTLDRVGAKVLSLFQRAPRFPGNTNIRDYQSADLPQCRELLNELTEETQLGILWDEEKLAPQLQSDPISRTLIYEKAGKLCGLLNYCRMDFQANGVLPVGLIDLIALQRLSGAEKVQMLNHSLAAMAEEGIKLVMLLKPGPTSSKALLKTGFVPRLNDFSVQMLTAETDFVVKSVKHLHILWR